MPERILYRDVITYPPLREDFAFVVDEGVPAGELIAAARDGGRRGAARGAVPERLPRRPIPAGKKSVAFAVAFQSPSGRSRRTTARACGRPIVDALAGAFGATLRA